MNVQAICSVGFLCVSVLSGMEKLRPLPLITRYSIEPEQRKEHSLPYGVALDWGNSKTTMLTFKKFVHGGVVSPCKRMFVIVTGSEYVERIFVFAIDQKIHEDFCVGQLYFKDSLGLSTPKLNFYCNAHSAQWVLLIKTGSDKLAAEIRFPNEMISYAKNLRLKADKQGALL